MRRERVVFCFAMGLFFAAVVPAAACNSEDARPPAATDFGSPPNGLGSGSGPSVDGGGDAATTEDAAGACTAVPLGGQVVEEQLLASATPTAIGGAIAPGTYDLNELDAYDPTASATSLTGRSAQVTIVVTADVISISESRSETDAGAPVSDVRAFSYVVSGTSLLTTTICPTAGNVATLPFTSSGGGLAIQTDATHREVYHSR